MYNNKFVRNLCDSDIKKTITMKRSKIWKKIIKIHAIQKKVLNIELNQIFLLYEFTLPFNLKLLLVLKSFMVLKEIYRVAR